MSFWLINVLLAIQIQSEWVSFITSYIVCYLKIMPSCISYPDHSCKCYDDMYRVREDVGSHAIE